MGNALKLIKHLKKQVETYKSMAQAAPVLASRPPSRGARYPPLATQTPLTARFNEHVDPLVSARPSMQVMATPGRSRVTPSSTKLKFRPASQNTGNRHAPIELDNPRTPVFQRNCPYVNPQFSNRSDRGSAASFQRAPPAQNRTPQRLKVNQNGLRNPSPAPYSPCLQNPLREYTYQATAQTPSRFNVGNNMGAPR